MTKQKKIKIGIVLIVLAFISAMCFTSCTNEPVGKTTKVENNETGESYVIKEIDGCQYIEVGGGYTTTKKYAITHKGNCNNTFHQCK